MLVLVYCKIVGLMKHNNIEYFIFIQAQIFKDKKTTVDIYKGYMKINSSGFVIQNPSGGKIIVQKTLSGVN